MRKSIDFAWIKWNGESYICRIIDWRNEVCTVNVGDMIIDQVPVSELQAIYGTTLPWEK